MEKIRANVCEFPYEFGAANSRTRFLQTTAEGMEGGYASGALPRIETVQGGMRQKSSYYSL